MIAVTFDEMPELEQSFELELAPCGSAWIQTASYRDLVETRDQIMLELERRKSARD
jgi:hypothetical protein